MQGAAEAFWKLRHWEMEKLGYKGKWDMGKEIGKKVCVGEQVLRKVRHRVLGWGK